MEVSRDHEPTDWDAAWEALVLGRQRPRHQRVALAVGQLLVTLAVMGVAVWLLVQLVAPQLHGLGRFGA
jgi:flagellar biogenesis protein FliO